MRSQSLWSKRGNVDKVCWRVGEERVVMLIGCVRGCVDRGC